MSVVLTGRGSEEESFIPVVGWLYAKMWDSDRAPYLRSMEQKNYLD